MRCDRAQRLMDRYLAEELPAVEREDLKFHLRKCPGCQQQWAQLQTLLGTLRRVPAPPMPQGFVGRVMAMAGQEIDRQGTSVEARARPAFWWQRVVRHQQIGFAAALAAGLLVGVLLGHQTWHHSASTSTIDRPTANVQVTDAENVYLIDYLTGTPRGSFPEIYLSLTSVDSDQEL
jgi:anti-sigma factor RsiW